MSLAGQDPEPIRDAAELITREQYPIDESKIEAKLETVRQRKGEEHGRWRDAENALLDALGYVRRQGDEDE